MWILLPLLAAIGLAYTIIRRIRLVKENRERARSIELVEAAFLETSEEFSVPKARDLLQTIRTGKYLRHKFLQPELHRLEGALSTASQWSYKADPERERTAVLNGVAHLYVKWRHVRASL